MPKRATSRRASFRLPVAAFAWNICLGLSTLLIPLHARDSGLSATEIGGLLGLPVLAQLAFLLLGGAYADRIGGRKVMLVSCALFALCAVSLLLGTGLIAIAAGQLLLVVARSVFWPAVWSFNAQAGNDDTRGVGRLNAFINAGQLIGTLGAGLAVAAWGTAAGFALMVASVGVSAAAVRTIPVQCTSPAIKAVQAGNSLGTYLRFLKMPVVHYANLCSFVSSVPLTLASSFIPLLLTERGIEVDIAGIALSMRAVGAFVAGFAVIYIITSAPSTFVPSIVTTLAGVFLLMLGTVESPVGAGTLIFALGFASAVMNAYFQLLLSNIERGESRGSLMAISSLGVMGSHICIPVLTGYLASHWGLAHAFTAAAFVALACAVALPLLRQRFDRP